MRQFVADASHELRTPLTAIRGYAEYYRQRGGLATVPAAAARARRAASSRRLAQRPGSRRIDMDRIMQRVEQESARMGVLVEDMLLLARLDQQRPLEPGPVDLLTLAADAVQDARIIAPDRDIDLTVEPGAAFLVLGDEPRLRQVIGNLMSNALTHTPDGHPGRVRQLRRWTRGPATRRQRGARGRPTRARADPGAGRAGVRALLPGRPGPDAGHRRQRARPGHRGRAGGRARRHRRAGHAPGPGRHVPDHAPAGARGAGQPATRTTSPRRRRPRPGASPHAGPAQRRPAASSASEPPRRSGRPAQRGRRGRTPSRYAAPNRHACTSSGCSWCSGIRDLPAAGQRSHVVVRPR